MRGTAGFGWRLEHALAIHQVSGAELARRLEDLGIRCSQTTVSSWVRGRTIPPAWKLVAIAHALKVPLRRLVTDVP